MARQALIEKEKKREKLFNRYKNKRAELKAVIKDPKISMDEKFKASLLLSKLPRNSAKIRQRNRCKIDGRPRGYMRKFGMSRLWFRKYASSGEMPGIKKASW